MKYFDKNELDGKSLDLLHNSLGKAFNCVSSNLFFHEVHDEADTEHHRTTLAKSAYVLIAVCEAIIDRVPEDEAVRALEECRERFEPDDDEPASEAAKMLAALILGRL